MTRPQTVIEQATEFCQLLIAKVGKDIDIVVVVKRGAHVAIAASDPILGARINPVFSDNPVFIGVFPPEDKKSDSTTD